MWGLLWGGWGFACRSGGPCGVAPDCAGPSGRGFLRGGAAGNGGLGAVVTTRPDAVVIHFGHNNVWDIRIAENNKDKIARFREVFDKSRRSRKTRQASSRPRGFAQYLRMTQEKLRQAVSASVPVRIVVAGFDRRDVGAFLVSASCAKGQVERVEILSEGRGHATACQPVE